MKLVRNTKNAHRTSVPVKITTELNTVLGIIAKDQKVTKAQLIEYVLGNFATQLVNQVAKAKGLSLDKDGNAIVDSTQEATSHDETSTVHS